MLGNGLEELYVAAAEHVLRLQFGEGRSTSSAADFRFRNLLAPSEVSHCSIREGRSCGERQVHHVPLLAGLPRLLALALALLTLKWLSRLIRHPAGLLPGLPLLARGLRTVPNRLSTSRNPEQGQGRGLGLLLIIQAREVGSRIGKTVHIVVHAFHVLTQLFQSGSFLSCPAVAGGLAPASECDGRESFNDRVCVRGRGGRHPLHCADRLAAHASTHTAHATTNSSRARWIRPKRLKAHRHIRFESGRRRNLREVLGGREGSKAVGREPEFLGGPAPSSPLLFRRRLDRPTRDGLGGGVGTRNGQSRPSGTVLRVEGVRVEFWSRHGKPRRGRRCATFGLLLVLGTRCRGLVGEARVKSALARAEGHEGLGVGRGLRGRGGAHGEALAFSGTLHPRGAQRRSELPGVPTRGRTALFGVPRP